jgi:hypothetical protein
MAYRQIVLDPDAYGIVLPDLENHPYFVAIDVNNDIDVALVTKLAEIPTSESIFPRTNDCKYVRGCWQRSFTRNT